MYCFLADQKKGIDDAGLGRLSLGQLSNAGEETILAGMGTAVATAGDQTYMTQDDDDAELLQRKPLKSSTAAANPPLRSALKKKTNVDAEGASKATASAAPAKGRITLAEKKRREAKAAEIIETLPLEYRGSDAVSVESPLIMLKRSSYQKSS